MSRTGWKYDEDKSEAENWEDYVAERDAAAEDLAAAYEEAGTLPPGASPQPDYLTPVANYASRDNIVVSGASPSEFQSVVEHLGDEDEREEALDAADVASGKSREEYEAALASLVPEVEQPEVPVIEADEADEPEQEEDDAEASYDDWNKADLQAEAEARDLDVCGTGANGAVTKADLVAALKEDEG